MPKLKIIFARCFLVLTLYSVMPPAARADNDWDRSITGVSDFADAQSQLQVLVNIWGFHKINHFCVVAAHDLSAPVAEVYWPTEGKLILWEPGDDVFSLLDSRDYVDLAHDVVANADDITMRYMVIPWTRPDVNHVINNCARYGTKFDINKLESGWVSIDKIPRFSSIRIQLQTLVDEQGNEKINNFCVIGQQGGAYLAAYVYWANEDRLIIWNPDPHDFDASYGLTDSYSNVDLKNASVDQEYFDRSNEEIPRSYVNQILSVCGLSGQKFVLIRQG